ncbi:MAG: hypothetical protein WA825_12310 [Steroidobacteraceae bacterium]
MASQTSRIMRLKEMLGFVSDLGLQFWPPYRTEIEDEEKMPAQHSDTEQRKATGYCPAHDCAAPLRRQSGIG